MTLRNGTPVNEALAQAVYAALGTLDAAALAEAWRVASDPRYRTGGLIGRVLELAGIVNALTDMDEAIRPIVLAAIPTEDAPLRTPWEE